MKKNDLCDFIESKAVDNLTVQTTYKIRGGSYVNVKSIFDKSTDLKDAIYPAAVRSAIENSNA
jgi:hypothetical protein